MKRFKNLLLMSLAVSIVLTTPIFAKDYNQSFTLESKENELVKYLENVNNQLGIKQGKSEEFKKIIQNNVSSYAAINNVTLEEAYDVYLEEIKREVDLSNISTYGGDDIGDTQLPTAAKGNIFFVDNSMPYNHVGLYTAYDSIVESMPKDGVQVWDIINKESWQSPNETDYDDSCILKVSNVSFSEISDVVDWATSYEDTPYDIDFIDNKSDYTYIINQYGQIISKIPEDVSFNCSELVWKAFYKKAGIDLDSNGGLAVYPNNIYNSSNASIVKSF